VSVQQQQRLVQEINRCRDREVLEVIPGSFALL